MERFGSDFRAITPAIPPAKIEPDGTKTWEVMCGMRIKNIGTYDEPYDFPLRNYESVKDVEGYPWPDPDDFDIANGKREEARKLHENTDYAVVGESFFSSMPFNVYAQIGGMDKWLIDMKIRPKVYFAICDRLLEYGLAMDAKFYEAVGNYIDIAVMFDDLGAQNGPLMSYQDWAKFVRPYTKQIIANIKRYTSAKILMHNCGSIYTFIPGLAEIGVDAVHGVMPLAWHMEPWRLKKDFGDIMTFFGGIDIQRLLPYGRIEEVREGVRKTIEAYAPAGGYILAPAHNLEPDTLPGNIVGMYEAAQEFGKYPIG
jgi:uroporphyrinogen decarboxylase